MNSMHSSMPASSAGAWNHARCRSVAPAERAISWIHYIRLYSITKYIVLVCIYVASCSYLTCFLRLHAKLRDAGSVRNQAYSQTTSGRRFTNMRYYIYTQRLIEHVQQCAWPRLNYDHKPHRCMLSAYSPTHTVLLISFNYRNDGEMRNNHVSLACIS